jgi:hypothetical protein
LRPSPHRPHAPSVHNAFAAFLEKNPSLAPPKAMKKHKSLSLALLDTISHVSCSDWPAITSVFVSSL